MASNSHFGWRIFLGTLICALVLGVSFVIASPMILINGLKPKLQNIIYQQTGIPAQILGDVNFSLLGRATLVANNVTIPTGHIKSVSFTIPFWDIFDIPNAHINGDITIKGGRFTITKLQSLHVAHNIDIYNSTVNFLGKDYDIIRGVLNGAQLTGSVRTDQHKYDFTVSDDEFHIVNQNDNLVIDGSLYSDGTARGRMEIATNNINSWFEFDVPRITSPVQMTANFTWDGEYGFDFSDIRANNVTGNIKLLPDGKRIIKLASKNLTFDFSFLQDTAKFFHNIEYDIDFYGDLTFGKNKLKHLLIQAIGTDSEFKIQKIIADDVSFIGGNITETGAHDVFVKMPIDGQTFTCVFSGTPTNWGCSAFTFGNMTGHITVNDGHYDVFVVTDDNMSGPDVLQKWLNKLGMNGHVAFTFADVAGTLDAKNNDISMHYTRARDKTIKWLNYDFAFMPEFMQNDVGDMHWYNETAEFTPHTGRWALTVTGNRFKLTGTDFKDLFPDTDLQFLRNDLNYTISGTYGKETISDMVIKIANHEFSGSMNKDILVLKTPLFNLDSFINQKFIDNYEELSFMTNAPIMSPFGLGINISLRANTLIYNGEEYANFVYALKPDVQTFSITDNARGNLLAIIQKENNNYAISLQLGRFITQSNLLSSQMPLNVRNTTVTGEIDMTTFGNIAHDLEYNLMGTIDLTFEGGYINGLGIDQFYASANDINRMNAEYAISDALESGETYIKKMQITGNYMDGNFKTTTPLTLNVRHADAIGNLEINDGAMSADLDITMRGISTEPAVITLQIMPDGSRRYSLSDIMNNFDPSFMRAFIRTHDKF